MGSLGFLREVLPTWNFIDQIEGSAMVSDSYTLRYLLQATRDVPERIVWREQKAGDLVTDVDGVEVLLTEVSSRAGIRVGLRFRCGNDEFWLYSPLPFGWSRRRYTSVEEQDLAELLQELFQAARAQCARKKHYDTEHGEEIRERVYRQLLFGPSGA
jgi:hypothetical protein